MAKSVQYVFKRYENKYMIQYEKIDELKSRLSQYMKADDYGQYTISNIYFDTDRFDLIRSSIEKPVYKEKLRIRSYGQVGNNDNVFVEIKKKYEGIVYKRRIGMPWEQANGYFVTKQLQPLPSETQIQREISWFMQSYNPVPKVFLAYDRTALSGIDNSNLRITFDSNIRWRETNLDLSCDTEGELLLPEKTILLEIKIPGTVPIWLARILSEMELFPASYSKYGSCYTNGLINEWLPRVEEELSNSRLIKETGVKMYA